MSAHRRDDVCNRRVDHHDAADIGAARQWHGQFMQDRPDAAGDL
ncbi:MULTISPECIES: hypothetical protein [unclassified Yoonia]|nr:MULTISPECIES: hypothetical protein [unclassified Yoonia]